MNIHNISLKHLRVFATVAQFNSLTRAAGQLCITKSAASMALQELEHHLDQPLFDRTKNRLVINSQGELMRPIVDEILQRIQTIETVLTEDSLTSGKLRIGASKTVGNHILPALLGDFLQDCQCQRPDITIRNTAQLATRLENFELDFALVEGSVKSNVLVSESWFHDEMLILARPDHPLANGEIHNITALNDEHWVLRENHSGTRDQFSTLLEPVLNAWHLGLEINTNEAVINGVAAGIGLGFMSHMAARDALRNQRIAVIQLGIPLERTLNIVYHRDKFHGPLLKRILEFTRHWRLNH